MPIVPTAQRAVGTAPLPGVRVTRNAPAEAFAPAPDLSGVEQAATRWKADADQIAINSADVQASQLRNQVHAQITAAQGTNALGALETARQAWQEGVQKIAGGLNDQQRRYFEARAGLHWAELQGTAEQHAATELRAADTQTTDALLDQSRRDAIDFATDPAKLAGVVEKTRAIVADYGRRQGWTPEVVAQKTTEALSAAHMGVFQSLVDAGSDLAAKAYLDAHRGELTADAITKADHLERASSVRGAAQRIADGITAKTTDATSLADAIDQVPKDTDPDVREHAEERVRRFFYDRASSERQSRAENFRQASQILEQTGDVDKIPLSIRTQLSPSEMSSLTHRSRQMTEEPGDDATYFRLMNMAAMSPASRSAFLKENLLSYPNLSEVQRRRLLNRQVQLSLRYERNPKTGAYESDPAGHVESTPAAASAPGSTPAAPAAPSTPSKPANPLAGLLTAAGDEPKKKPTPAMLLDVQKHGKGYGDYLREHGYDIPADAHVVPAEPAGKKK